MEWYVYASDELPGGIATVHAENCKFVTRNQGRSSGEHDHDGRWLGPFAGVAEASAAAKATGCRFTDPCWFCG